MMILGIDPGLDGAIAFYDQKRQYLDVFDIPTLGTKKQRVINASALVTVIDSHSINQSITAYLEDVHAMIGWGIGSAFRFGESKGVILGVIGALHIPLRRISPQKWKKAAGLNRDKDASRKLASEIFPKYSSLFVRVKDNNRAEAALIAKYGWNELNK